MTARRGVVALLIVCCAAGSGYAMDHVAGLLSLGSSARALGMGDAFCALADEGTGVWYNPAALAWDEAITLGSFLARDFGAIAYGALTLGLPHAALGITQLDSGAIPVPDGTLRYVSRALVGAAAIRFGPVALGVRGTLYTIVRPREASGWAIDPAIQMVTELLRIGAVWENAISEPVRHAEGHVEPWTPAVNVGAATSMDVGDGIRWTVLLEGRGLFAPTPLLTGGAELAVGPVAIRTGYDGKGLTFGIGVVFLSYALDWAYTDHPGLGEAHRVSVTFRF
jgi:hypothetical protein